ncbi:MAG: hypothetical protein IAE90_12005 [Ignavibacteria bacterium]|nr:hypothetical protein [Ignavibacteria bacterium]
MNKLIQLICSFSEAEILRFEEFAASPFHNKRRDIKIFAQFLKQNHPLKEIDRKKLYELVYGTGIYNEQVMINLFSRTLNLVKEFLKQLGLEKDPVSGTNAMAYELARKGQLKLVEQMIEKGISDLDAVNYSVEYLMKFYEYAETRDALVTGFRNNNARVKSAFVKGEAAVNYNILNLLRIANDFVVFGYFNSIMDNDRLFNGFFNYFDFEKYLENLEKIGSPYYALTAVFYYGLLSKQNDPAGIYREKLKDVVFENLDTLRYQDQATCWTMLFAAYVFNGTPGRGDNSSQIHSINKMFVEKDILTKDELGYVMENNFHNIAFQAINAGDFEWAEEFLNKYRDKLPPDLGDNTYNLCMSRCFFEKGDFEGSLVYLSRLKYFNPIGRCNTSILFIKCYYELGYYEQALYAAEAFKAYMYQNKELTQKIKRPFEHFAKYAILLTRIKASGAKLDESVFIKAQKPEAYSSRVWVMKKMEELR